MFRIILWSYTISFMGDIFAMLCMISTMWVSSFFAYFSKQAFGTNVDNYDGTILTICSVLLKELKIFKVDVFGEPELGEKQYQSICFLKKLNKDEFIPTEAMSKLRQVCKVIIYLWSIYLVLYEVWIEISEYMLRMQ